MVSWDTFDDTSNQHFPPTGEDKGRSTAPFFLLWLFLGSNLLTLVTSWVIQPSGINSWIWLGVYWLVSFLLMIVGYYVFSVAVQQAKLNPDYSTNPSSETRNRLIFLLTSFTLTCLAAFPLAYELSRLVRY